MKTQFTPGIGAIIALVVGNIAGFIDLVALPIWVGALQENFGFSLPQSGGLVTIFLLGAVCASFFMALRFNRVNQKTVAVAGFAVGAVAFYLASNLTDFMMLALSHLVAGLGVGSGFSMIHGTMGRSQNPHRLFAIGGIAVGLFAIIFIAIVPQLMLFYGAQSVFLALAGVMAIAAATNLILFKGPGVIDDHAESAPFDRVIWLLILGASLMTFNQAMVFSFVELIGENHGFSTTAILNTLIALGIVNFILPSPAAALLEKRLPAYGVVQTGPIVQALLAVVITSVAILPVWAPVAAVFVSVQIFTITFLFGLLARIEPTGRAVSATPGMLMIGAAFGPLAGGVISESFGFPAIGICACIVGISAMVCFNRSRAANTKEDSLLDDKS